MDARQRNLERQAGHDPSREAGLLLERVRGGQLSDDRLRLAAWLGNPAALAATGLEVEADLRRWTLGVAHFGQEAFVRALTAALRSAAVRHDHLVSRAAVEVVLDGLDAWCEQPTPDTAAEVRALAEDQLAPNLGQTLLQRGNPSHWALLGAAQVAVRNLHPDWVAEVPIPTRLSPDQDLGKLEAIRDHFAQQGALVRWSEGPEGMTLWVSDCGSIGASGVTKALIPLTVLEPLTLLERLRPVRERSSPAVFAATVAGEPALRQAVAEAVIPWALQGIATPPTND